VTAAPVTAAPTVLAPERVLRRARRGRRPLADLAAVAVYLGLGMLVMAEYLVDPNGRVSGHLAVDQTWFEWLLAHGAHAVQHGENPLFSMRQNVPNGVNMMANTSVLGVTIPLAPLTMWLGPKVVYVVWMIGACAGTASTTYWVLSRHLVQSRAAAFVGGAFAGFAPGVMHHANGQPNFVSNFLLPLIVLRVARLGVHGRWLRDGLILALLVTYQIFINEELLLTTAAACGVAVLAFARQHRAEARRRAGAFLRALGVTAVAAGVLCAYPLWFQFFGPQTFRGLRVFHSWGEDPVTYLTWPRDTVGGSPTAETTVGLIEQNTWFGWPLTLLVVVLIVALWRRSTVTRVGGVVAVVFAVAALGPHLRLNGRATSVPGPWSLVPDDLPVLGLLMPSRLTYAVIGVVVVMVAVGWDQLGWRDPVSPRRGLITVGVRLAVAAALLPLIPTPMPTQESARPPVFITSGAWRPYVPEGRTLIPAPIPDNGGGLDSLAWSAWGLHEFPVPGGYFLGPGLNGEGRMGPATVTGTAQLIASTVRTGTTPVVTDAMRSTARADVAYWRGSVVVLAATPEQEPVRGLLDQLFGPGQRVLDVWVWDVG
jgi:hypothetical protein